MKSLCTVLASKVSIYFLHLCPSPLIYSSSATEDSWNETYIGQAHVALKAHTMSHWHLDPYHNPYAPYCAIIQSSGTGKSRMVDEFSKQNFVIPLNLRHPEAKGVHLPPMSLSLRPSLHD